MKNRFTEEEIAEIQETRRKNRDKNVERRLKALKLKAEGRTGQEIAEMTGYNPGYISKLAGKYRKGGMEAISGNHYGGNRRNMTYEEEAELLEQFINEAEGGYITDVSAMKPDMDRYTMCCTAMAGAKSCREANTRKVRHQSRWRPQKN